MVFAEEYCDIGECETCKVSLNNDPVTSTYLDDFSRGGLDIQISDLNSCTQCAFSILEHINQRILEGDVPFKVWTQSILKYLSSELHYLGPGTNYLRFKLTHH